MNPLVIFQSKKINIINYWLIDIDWIRLWICLPLKSFNNKLYEWIKFATTKLYLKFFIAYAPRYFNTSQQPLTYDQSNRYVRIYLGVIFSSSYHCLILMKLCVDVICIFNKIIYSRIRTVLSIVFIFTCCCVFIFTFLCAKRHMLVHLFLLFQELFR